MHPRSLHHYPRQLFTIGVLLALPTALVAGAAGGSGPGAASNAVVSEPLPALPLYRANLHSHTGFSDGGVLRYRSTERPLSAFREAQRNGLDVLAVTDHGEGLTPREWSRTLEDAVAATGPEFVALPGFEWTQTHSVGLFSHRLFRKLPHPPRVVRGAGHINVLGARQRVGWAEAGIPRSDIRRTLAEFYEWLADPRLTAIDGGAPVAQFNHPTTYDNIDRFAEFALPAGEQGERLRERVALIELGALVVERYEGGARPGRPLRPAHDNEFWFRRALDRGWRVGPANSEDNHGGHYGLGLLRNPRRPRSRRVFPRTGIYATGLTPAAILEALRRRRVFATEDRSAALRLMARREGEAPWHWMGSALPDAPGASLLLEVEVNSPEPLRRVDIVGAGDREWLVPLAAGGETGAAGRLRIPAEELARLPRTERGEQFFYARVFQRDGDLLYSAPIWLTPAPVPALPAGRGGGTRREAGRRRILSRSAGG